MEETINLADLETDMTWLKEIIRIRCENPDAGNEIIPQPESFAVTSHYGQVVTGHNLSQHERFILLLALVPHTCPEALDVLQQGSAEAVLSTSETGGRRGTYHNGILPTIQTFLFLMCGRNLAERGNYSHLLSNDSKLIVSRILKLDIPDNGEPINCSLLNVHDEVLEKIKIGNVKIAHFPESFPVRAYSTNLNWDDMILAGITQRHLQQVRLSLKYNSQLEQFPDFKRRIQEGNKILFYGPSGTGKSATAALLARECGKTLYRIDLSELLSRFIGETEKNLARLFEMAEMEDAILFFDEADALFGKRGVVSNAHDRYANQEVSYLLQRIEDYPGFIILASNFRENIDAAFSRRFQSFVNFPLPDQNDRLKLWQKYLPDNVRLHEKIDLKRIADFYELTGASIMNATRIALLHLLQRGDNTLLYEDLIEGIAMEHTKLGKQMKMLP